MHVIEMLGLPGSGKTTLASEITKSVSSASQLIYPRTAALADNRPPFVRHLVRSRYVLVSFPRRPGMFWASMRLINEDKQPNFRSFLKVCWNMWCVLGWYVWLGRNAKGIAIVDQGILQAIWSVRLTALNRNADWLGFLKQLDIIDGVVIVECDPTALNDRITKRGDQLTRLDGVSSDSVLWRSGAENFSTGKSEAAAVAPVIQVSNDTASDRKSALPNIIDWIEGIAAPKQCDGLSSRL